MKKQNQTNKILFIVAIVAAVILIGGWLYLSLQKPVLEIVTDKPAYFTVDKPMIEIRLINPKNADSGEVSFTYDKEILKLANSENTQGVTMRELDNKIIFELNKEYFDSKNTVISKLIFESHDTGVVPFTFDKANSKLTVNSQNIEVGEFMDKKISIGTAQER